MSIENRLDHLAKRYRTLGFNVVFHPRPDDLPPFAKDFKVEIAATKEDGSVLVSAKNSPTELEADPNVARYADITNEQPGWRFDVVVLGPDSQPLMNQNGVKEPTETELLQYLEVVQQMLQAGFHQAAFVTAWAALDAAMRVRLRAEGEEVGWGSSPRTMLNELYSSGGLSTTALREMEHLFQLRNMVVHGFSPPVVVDENVVRFLEDTARRLLEESQPAKQTA